MAAHGQRSLPQHLSGCCVPVAVAKQHGAQKIPCFSVPSVPFHKGRVV